MSSAVAAPLEVLTMGSVRVDVYSEQVGVSFEDVTSFRKYFGGSATNVAVAAARHGRRSALVTRTGEDPFGRFVHVAPRGFGVDNRFVSAVPSEPLPHVANAAGAVVASRFSGSDEMPSSDEVEHLISEREEAVDA